ncbi:MAG: hypothetical protein HPY63_04420 [Methanobacteriaceae archaeon]|uniref:Uncharacterized protein n=1 Tax=Methanothermobacter tenebrarum TaxID=680118 RepID=A0A328P800_9EURY|nr:hypothetical protein [Methanobacteriaceae archaeon]RAO78438.1 hypothetical protein DPC56_08100 [Methanothermobacter tenebrarum]
MDYGLLDKFYFLICLDISLYFVGFKIFRVLVPIAWFLAFFILLSLVLYYDYDELKERKDEIRWMTAITFVLVIFGYYIL